MHACRSWDPLTTVPGPPRTGTGQHLQAYCRLRGAPGHAPPTPFLLFIGHRGKHVRQRRGPRRRRGPTSACRIALQSRKPACYGATSPGRHRNPLAISPKDPALFSRFLPPLPMEDQREKGRFTPQANHRDRMVLPLPLTDTFPRPAASRGARRSPSLFSSFCLVCVSAGEGV